MRVIAGIYKGRRLKFPKIEGLRPTQDRVKESMFEIIKLWLPDAALLELFAGSGSLGIEALSRGARSVTFVERDSLCLKTIEENLDDLGIAVGAGLAPALFVSGRPQGPPLQNRPSAVIIKSDIYKALRRFADSGDRFGIIIADPPYGMGHIRKLLIKLNEYDILKKPHLVVIEHSEKEQIPQKEGSIILQRQYKYGAIFLSIYQKDLTLGRH